MSEVPFVPLDFPPWIRWRVRACPDLPQPEGTGPNGRPLCRWCASEVPTGRQSWCSDRCSGKFRRVFSWGDIAAYVRDRDRKCQRCGTKHPGWKATRASERIALIWPDGHIDAGRWHYLAPTACYRDAPSRELGKPGGYYARLCDLREWWEVDHIREVVNGGTDDPANLRLLCHRCHVESGVERRAETKRLNDPQKRIALEAA